MDLLSLKEGSSHFKRAAKELMAEDVTPLVNQSIDRLSEEVQGAIAVAGQQLDRNIAMLSEEIHNHRSMTRDDISALIDYAAQQFGAAIDLRVAAVKEETSQLINDKVDLLKKELQEAAVTSRHTMYTNAAISTGAALGMAAIGLVYKKVSLGELDLLAVFRIALLSCATFSFVLGVLKAFQHWRVMQPAKKNFATIALGYLGLLRPNGAAGMVILSIAMLAGWLALQHYS